MALAVPILAAVLPHLVSPAVREWSLAHLLVVIPVSTIGALALCYWWWARSDASAREALRQIALHGRIAMPAGDLAPDDLLWNPRQVGPPSAFLPRNLRRFGKPDAAISSMADAIPSLLPEEGQPGRRVAIIGAAAMGKTRLVHELIRQLPPETIIFAPGHDLRDLGDAALRHATRYLGGRPCVLVFDDLNFYVGRTNVAEIEQVVIGQAASYSIAVTCTTSTLPQVRSEVEPALKRFFGSLDQYEILRMTDEEMDVLAINPAGRATERDPRECGGNPGLLLIDFQRLREEFDSLSRQDRATADAVHSLFVAGISPIKVEHVRSLASSGFGADLDTPTVRGTLDCLRSMSFIRESDPVLPEEAFLREVVPEDAVWARMDEVEGVLGELQDVNGLFQLGQTHFSREDFERVSRVMRLVDQLSRAVNTPEGLVGSAWALCNLGEALERWKQEPQQIELAYHQAAIAGRESTHPEGLVAAALALLNLGAELVAWGREPQEIEATFRGAAAAGRQSATPEGLMMTAGAFFGLGESLEGWGREPQEIEAAWRGAATAARESTHPGSLVIAARALLCLGKALEGWGREPQEIEAAWRDAATAGRESATPEGLMIVQIVSGLLKESVTIPS